MVNKLRILIAENHETVREGFQLIIQAQKDMPVGGEADDGRAAVELARTLCRRTNVFRQFISDRLIIFQSLSFHRFRANPYYFPAFPR